MALSYLSCPVNCALLQRAALTQNCVLHAQVEGNDGPGTLLYGHDYYQSTQQDTGDPALAASEDAEGEVGRCDHVMECHTASLRAPLL